VPSSFVPLIRPPRVDLKARKLALDALLGDSLTQSTYWNLVEKYLMVKLSKKELDEFVIETIGMQNRMNMKQQIQQRIGVGEEWGGGRVRVLTRCFALLSVCALCSSRAQ
jgi:hypothetical protein